MLDSVKLCTDKTRSADFQMLRACVPINDRCRPTVITRVDGSRVSMAIIRVCDSVCLSVCPHGKTKTAKSKIAKIGTGIVHHDTLPTNSY